MVHVLIATDFSAEAEACFEFARTLASWAGAENVQFSALTILEDIGQKSPQFQFALAMLDSHGIREQLQKQALAELKELQNAYLSGFTVETAVVRAGKAVHLEIAEYAAAHGVNLIIIAAHSRTGISPVIVGGVLEKLTREAPCPVAVVPIRKKD